MASQSQIEDEILAKQLQEEEYAEQRRHEQMRHDQALARQMSTNQYAIQAGQSVVVRLHHPRTTRQIGEVLYAHYVQQNLMQFELANMRGKYLRATSSGTVEFTSSNDDKCKFFIEPAPNGTMYLLNKNYAGRANVNNTPGWYLSMSFDGQLSSNGYKCELSQWALVAAAATPPTGPAAAAAPQPTIAAPPAAAIAPAAAPAPPAVIPRSPPQAAAAPAPAPVPAFDGSSLPPPGGEVEMEDVTNFQFNPLFANRPPPAESASSSSSSAARATAVSAAAAAAVGAAAGGAAVAAVAVTATASNDSSTAAAPRPVSYSYTNAGTSAYPAVPQIPTPAATVVNVSMPPPSRPPLEHSVSQAIAAVNSTVLLFPGHDAGRDALMRFFLTPGGITFLQQPQYADAFVLYNAGTLGKILHRPDWPIVAGRFVDLVKALYPALNVAVADAALPLNDGKAFFEDGYCVARSVVPADKVQRALKISNYWLSRYAQPTSAAEVTNLRKYKSRVEISGAVATDYDLLSLFYETPLVQIIQQFIGAGDVRSPSSVSVIHTFPSLDIPNEFTTTSTALQPTLSGDKWLIEGFDGKGGHSTHNILIGIALTDQSVPFVGNVVVFPGSQMVLMETYKHQVATKGSVLSEDPHLYKKIDLGEPTQLLLQAGDAVILTQRLAHFYSTNASNTSSTMAFFRISHVDHEVLKDPALDGMWLEFRGTEKYLENGGGGGSKGSIGTGGGGTSAAPVPAAAPANFLLDVQDLQIAPSAASTSAPPPTNYWDTVPAADDPIQVAQPYTPQMDD